MRKLASIQKISNIEPIIGADRIVKAEVLGWEVVVKKDEFKVGDLIVYFEVDSQLPPHPAYDDFMASRKYRVRTIKLKKQYSQGLILPIESFPELLDKSLQEGDDVTELLGVKKWEPYQKPQKNMKRGIKSKPLWRRFLLRYRWFRWLEVKIYGKSGRNFPTHLVGKTDETRIQSDPGLLNSALKHEETGKGLYSTEKLDGTSATYIVEITKKGWKRLFNPYRFYVCSRNLEKPMTKNIKPIKTFDNDGENTPWDENCYVGVARKYNIKEKMIFLCSHFKRYSEGIAIQGEIIGPSIQKNKYELEQQELHIFNLYFLGEKRYGDLEELKTISEELNIPTVPILDENYSVRDKTVKILVDEAEGKSVLNPKTEREGIVVRAKENKLISFKSISRKFLLKGGN